MKRSAPKLSEGVNLSKGSKQLKEEESEKRGKAAKSQGDEKKEKER